MSNRRFTAHRLSSLFILFCFIFPAKTEVQSNFGAEFCPTALRHVTVEPQSSVIIGAVLPIHRPGEGVLGCGHPAEEGVQVFEAMRWAVDVMNKQGGLNANNDGPWIPGVTLGLKVYDTCGHKTSAIDHLTSLFPVLRSGSQTCSPDARNTSLTIGLVDMSEITDQPEISDALRSYFIPTLSLSMSTAISAERMGDVLLAMMKTLKWHNAVVIHIEEEYSIRVTKLLSVAAESNEICLSRVHSFPVLDSQWNNNDLRPIRKILKTAISNQPDNTGVVIINFEEKTSSLILKVLAETPDIVSRLQFLFSWIPPPAALSGLGKVVPKSRIYSIAPYPEKVLQFEDYWNNLTTRATLNNVDDTWFLEYAMAEAGCRMPGFIDPEYQSLPLCSQLLVKDTPLDILTRSSRIVPAVTAVFTLATAFQRAWEVKCSGSSGICSELQSMSRKEFVGEFLEPIEFLANQKSVELKHRAPRTVNRYDTGGNSLALTKYHFNPENGINFTQVFVYDSHGSRVLDDSFASTPSLCPVNGCRTCFRPRQSRFEEAADSADIEDNLVVISGAQNDVIIPIFLPIHEPGNSPIECGAAINLEAIQNLEGALFTVDKINADASILSGVKFGIAVIDTCGSPLLTTQKLTNYVMQSQLSTNTGLIFISSTTPQETISANAVLKPLNISVVSASDITSYTDKDLGLENFIFQIPSSAHSKFQAAAEVIKNNGWKYVSIVFEASTHRNVQKALYDALAIKGVCVASAIEIRHQLNDTDVQEFIQKILDVKSRGVHVFLLQTSKEITKQIIKSVGGLSENRLINPGDFIFISVGEWEEGMGKEALGTIIVKPERGDTSEFLTYFQNLTPENNARNPWFDTFWHQEQMRLKIMSSSCPGDDCDTSLAEKIITEQKVYDSTVNTMQAVMSIAAGLVRLRNEVCKKEYGLCYTLSKQPLPQLISQYMVFTAAPKQDRPGHLFKFNYKGYGDTSTEIFNVRKGSGNSILYQKVGFYDGQLTILANAVVYREDGEIAAETISSDCVGSNCPSCKTVQEDHAIIPSINEMYIAAVLGVHNSLHANPLSCGELRPAKGFQNLEALMWALDIVNADSTIFPGIKLGLVAIDSCSSSGRVAIKFNDYLMSKERFEEDSSYYLPNPDNIVAVITDETDTVVKQIADVTSSLNMTTVATRSMSSEMSDVKKYPNLLKMKLPNKVVVSCIFNLLRHFHWSYVSVVHLEERGDYHLDMEMFQEFKQKAESQSVKIALEEKVQLDSPEITSTMDIIAHRLKIKQKQGARVVLLFLPFSMIQHLLAAVQRLQTSGRIQAGDFVWITYDNLEPFQMYPDQSAGAITIREKAGDVPQFKDYFMSLNIRNNTRNPWLKEYWEQVFSCRGKACYSDLHHSLQQVGFLQDRTVPHSVNALFSIVHGLSTLQRSVCPGITSNSDDCGVFQDKTIIRNHLFKFVREANFIGCDGRPIEFEHDNVALGSLNIYSFRSLNDDPVFVPIGEYDVRKGLVISTNRARAVDGLGHQLDLMQVSSACQGSCQSSSLVNTFSSTPFMKISGNQEFVLGAFFPVHQPGENLFSCSDVVTEESFQNLLALSFALNLVNKNETILPEINLGALVFDHCGRRQRAEEQIFGFFSKQRSEGLSSARSLVAAISTGPEIASDLSPLFDVIDIPLFDEDLGTGIKNINKTQRKRRSKAYDIKHHDSRIDVIMDLLNRMNWQYVNVIHNGANDVDFWSFIDVAKGKQICIAESISIENEMSDVDITDRLLEHFRSNEAKVVVLLIDSPILVEKILDAAWKVSFLEDYVWIGMENSKDKGLFSKALKGNDVDMFTIHYEALEVPGYKEYYSGFTLGQHEPIPDDWFEVYWQHRFQCHLSSSIGAHRVKYPKPCSGQESLGFPMWQESVVHRTFSTVTKLASTLHDYLRRYCIHGDAATNLDDCGQEAREIFLRETRKAMNALCDTDIDGDCGPIKVSAGFEVFQLVKNGDSHVYQQVGVWQDGKLSVPEKEIRFTTGVKPTSMCQTECGRCRDQLSQEELNTLRVPKPSLLANLRKPWGIITAALSLLGILLVISCAVYFLVSFQVTVGTTVLGYMILFGLLLLYAVNFSFILAPTEGTCGIRRFALGLAYSVIFAGMLVKVMNIWKMMGYRGNRLLSDEGYYVTTSPAALLVIAVGLVVIQVVLSSTWLILVPPSVDLVNGEWRCHPATTFEDGLVTSLVYVMLMLAVTLLFSTLTWRSVDNHNESRWIFACCLTVAFAWLVWTVTSTRIRHRYRDLTIVTANLACATVVMLCMYLRKVYIYHKLTRDQEFKRKPLQQVLPVPNMYGSPTALSQLPLKHTGTPPSNYDDRCIPSRMALITGSCDDGGSEGSSSSTQVQATDLYPLEMYDGGCQFQPASLHLGGSSLVLDESATFSR